MMQKRKWQEWPLAVLCPVCKGRWAEVQGGGTAMLLRCENGHDITLAVATNLSSLGPMIILEWQEAGN